MILSLTSSKRYNFRIQEIQNIFWVLVLIQSLFCFNSNGNNEQNKGSFISIVIYGEGSQQEYETSIKSVLDQPFKDYDIIVAVKNNEELNAHRKFLFKHYETFFLTQIKFQISQDLNDFAQIIQHSMKKMKGKFITLSHVKTKNFPERFNEISNTLNSQQISALVSDIQIKNNNDEYLSNKQTILRDYARSLNNIFFSVQPQIEFTLTVRKNFLEEIFRNLKIVNRFEILMRISQTGNIFQMPQALMSMTFDYYKKKYTNDFVIDPQTDNDMYQQYNGYLQNKNVKNLTTLQFSHFLNCTFDYLACDKETKQIVQYLLIDSYLMMKDQAPDSLKSLRELILQLNQNIRNQEKAAKNPTYYPLVSVVMASHDRDYFFLEAVRSVFQLSYTNWELLVVDDGSSNPLTYSILYLLEGLPKLRVSYLYTNWYCSFTNNFAIAQLKGEFFALLDDDDIMVFDRMEKQLSYMWNHPEVDFIGAQALYADQTGKITWGSNREFMNFWDIKLSLVTYDHFTHSTLFVRMNDKMKKHFYYENHSGPDYKQWFKLLIDLEHENIRIGMFPGHVLALREHPTRMSYTEYTAFIHIVKWIQRKQLDSFETFSPSLLEQMDHKCINDALHDISGKAWNIRACEAFNMEKVSTQILAYQQTKNIYSTNDIKELNETLQSYTQYYNQAVQNNRINMQPGDNRKIFVCLFSVGDSELAEKQIESLKEHADGLIIVDISTQLNYDLLKSKKREPSNISQKYNNPHKILVETLEYDFSKLIMQKFQQQLDNLRTADADYVLILGPGEFVNPLELRKFRNYRTDLGIFGLKQKTNSQLITSPKITTYYLLKFMGYEFLRKYDIDPDIFKFAGEHEFEDKVYTIQYDFGFLNVHTFKNGGYYLDKLE
ncbi:UNKNOWN [Stylonychia lemnae]|uniref:Glycosyltransferase 2-like domain-containing protein n=1 Tax=Stylonychia lemnae TaxID=5949 RepID=A0A078AFH9_STYLE|nr:UNKNOWN [Stylonychia lemnae]|eukprot:CDW79678.1 UNKNOWN [Stylonychia lemnae]